MSTTNGVMLQAFQWYLPWTGEHWDSLAARVEDLRKAGFTALWLPPAYKGQGGQWDVGYGCYDLFDLGEFDQKGSVRTKYGTRQQLIDLIQNAQAKGLHVLADVVFNHKDGGDEAEEVLAQQVAWDNRNQPIGSPYKIRAYTRFNFPGRGDRYSSFKWRAEHFDGVCYDANHPARGNERLFSVKPNHRFETEVSHEKGNYDYLLGCDLHTSHPDVITDLDRWGRWIVETTGVDGFRIDAVKHIRSSFFRPWLDKIRAHFGREAFAVGEYWTDNVQQLHDYLTACSGAMSLFDVPLHFRFQQASRQRGGYDLRQLVEGTLAQQQPAKAVTFVDNHDTQPCQALESWVEPWFKPHAYAFILLREQGYPCVFLGDYDGGSYDDRGREVTMWSHRWLIDKFLAVRQSHAWGPQVDYFDHPNTVGWTRLGDVQYPGTLAVLLANSQAGEKWMRTGRPNALYRDATEHWHDPVRTNEHGWGRFFCPGGSLSVWVEADG